MSWTALHINHLRIFVNINLRVCTHRLLDSHFGLIAKGDSDLCRIKFLKFIRIDYLLAYPCLGTPGRDFSPGTVVCKIRRGAGQIIKVFIPGQTGDMQCISAHQKCLGILLRVASRFQNIV